MNSIATAKQTASLLSLAGLAWVISHLPTIPDGSLYYDLRRPALAVLISLLLYLLLLGLQAFMHHDQEQPDERSEFGWASVHALVLLAVGGALLRGPRSFALLAGLEGPISVVAAVSAVALFVYGYSAWVVQREAPAASAANRRQSSRWLVYLLQAVACLPVLFSTAYLELMPSEQAERIQFQIGSEV